MKINTDGTLLGALGYAANPQTILDIGTGTGVVALMLAQRFPSAQIDAVEIEEHAAATATKNFNNSIFSERLKLYSTSFQALSETFPAKQYSFIVSNPPFFVNSLKNPDKKKQTARHSDHNFFTELIDFVSNHLEVSGVLSLILPPETGEIVIELAKVKSLFLSEVTNIRSFKESEVHRKLLTFTRFERQVKENEFVTYSIQKQYSDQFVSVLNEFFTIF